MGQVCAPRQGVCVVPPLLWVGLAISVQAYVAVLEDPSGADAPLWQPHSGLGLPAQVLLQPVRHPSMNHTCYARIDRCYIDIVRVTVRQRCGACN